MPSVPSWMALRSLGVRAQLLGRGCLWTPPFSFRAVSFLAATSISCISLGPHKAVLQSFCINHLSEIRDGCLSTVLETPELKSFPSWNNPWNPIMLLPRERGPSTYVRKEGVGGKTGERELAWGCIVSAPQGSGRHQPGERPGQWSRVYSAGLCPSWSPVRWGSWPGRPSWPWLRRAWSWALGRAVLTLYLAEERGCLSPLSSPLLAPGTCPWSQRVENDRPCWWSRHSTQLKGNGFLVFPFSATPKSSPGPDYLCWDDTLPDVRGHQREAGADGGPHELSAGSAGSGRTLSVPRAPGPRGWGFWFCFCCVLFCFLYYVFFVNTNKFL